MRIYAAVLGITLGLGMAYTQVARPARTPVTAKPQSISWQRSLTVSGLPPNGLPGTGNSGVLVEFEGRQYRVSPYANDIPFVMVGGRTLSINGGQSAPNR